MAFTLRAYQEATLSRMRELMASGKRSILAQGSTGSGKTAMAAHMIGTAAKRGMSSIFLVHRRELVKQSMLAFHEEGIPHGVIAAGFLEDKRQLVNVASIQTLARRLDSVKAPQLIVWDEVHHAAAGSWKAVRAHFPNAYHVGLTATPCRLDGQGLSEYFEEMVCGPSTYDLIQQGYLSKYKLFVPSTINTNGLHTRMGDFNQTELASVVDKPTITGDAIREYQKRAAGKRAVVFCVSIEHSKHVADQFQAAGFRAHHVDGETPAEDRDRAVREFSDGRLDILCNVDLFGEGFDLPSLEVAILLRPSQSLGLYLQQVGRALRPSPGKDHAIILDHAGNCQRHGLPDDEREWTLEGRDVKKRASEQGLAVRVCPKCFAASRAGVPVCQFCGYAHQVVSRVVAEVDGDLSEVDIEMARRERKFEHGQANSLNDLIELGKQRGYKSPYGWAKAVFNARQRRKLQRGRFA